MTQAVTTRSVGKNRCKLGPVNSSGTADIKKLAYKNLISTGMPARAAKRALGIGQNSSVSAKKTIDQQREEALHDLNLTIKSQFTTLLDIRDDKETSCASDRINAVKTINSMVPGFSAPQQMQVNNTFGRNIIFY